MDGDPVWLASASVRDRHGRLLPSTRWMRDASERLRMEKALLRTLDGVGDPSRQRLFRMPITLCLHRALSADEVAMLPGQCVPTHLAGGPLEVLWETVPGSLSTQPCKNPGRRPLDPFNADLYLLDECGRCPPCRARNEAVAV